MTSLMEPDDVAIYAAKEFMPLNNFTSLCTSVDKIQSNGIFNNSNPLHFSMPLLLLQFALASGLIVLFKLLLKPFNQPIVVSQILGGMIFGPSFLGRKSWFIRQLFPLRGFILIDIISSFGFMFYFFLIGAQMDPWIILKKINKKTFVLGFFTVAIPMFLTLTCSLVIMNATNLEPRIAFSLLVVSQIESVLAFPAIAHFLTELKITSSEFGRIALASSMVSGLFSFSVITISILAYQTTGDNYRMPLTIFTEGAIERNLRGCPVCRGLGPPVRSVMTEKLNLITTWMFMPLYFVKNGLLIDIFAVKFHNYLAVQSIALIAALGKFLGAFMISFYCNMPLKDAMALGLVMNAQGVIELNMFKMMKKIKVIDNEAFVRRTVMHSRPDSELRILVCIHDQENVPTIINLLEALNPSQRSPLSIYLLHLIELVGRANPLPIAHELTERPTSKASPSKLIVNAFRYYEHINHGVVTVFPFTAISHCKTMHDDVCSLALDKSTSLVIVPFYKNIHANGAMGSHKKIIRIVNNNGLDMAPCSIAILIEHGNLKTTRSVLATWSSYRVVVLFLGGADDREALALGARMAGHPNISLTVIRFLENGSVTSGNEEERKLDSEVVSEFRLSMAGNYHIMYIEEVVIDGTGTISVIQSMENNYELILVGRRDDRRSPLLLGLVDWNEQAELGAIGEELASVDFLGNTTILVVQQQTNIVNDGNNNNMETFGEQNVVEDDAEDMPIHRINM
uniref:Cation/H+ exchanger domain-containing protein n=1 Tax=Fagus sylvatica TaxID=28930 RepID=A0A2N9IFN1_FAGSY